MNKPDACKPLGFEIKLPKTSQVPLMGNITCVKMKTIWCWEVFRSWSLLYLKKLHLRPELYQTRRYNLQVVTIKAKRSAASAGQPNLQHDCKCGSSIHGRRGESILTCRAVQPKLSGLGRAERPSGCLCADKARQLLPGKQVWSGDRNEQPPRWKTAAWDNKTSVTAWRTEKKRGCVWCV